MWVITVFVVNKTSSEHFSSIFDVLFHFVPEMTMNIFPTCEKTEKKLHIHFFVASDNIGVVHRSYHDFNGSLGDLSRDGESLKEGCFLWA